MDTILFPLFMGWCVDAMLGKQWHLVYKYMLIYLVILFVASVCRAL